MRGWGWNSKISSPLQAHELLPLPITACQNRPSRDSCALRRGVMQRRASRKQLQAMQRAMLPKARSNEPAERPAEAAPSRPHRQDPSSDHTHPGASPAALKHAEEMRRRRTPYSEEELRSRRQIDTQSRFAASPNRSKRAGASQISLLVGQTPAHQEQKQRTNEKTEARHG
mgnify:CR=1 FL=1